MDRLAKFKLRGEEIHNGKYCYSKIVELNCVRDSVIIICPIHGEFEQVAMKHIDRKHGCRKCSRYAPITLTTFKLRATKYHAGKYDYSHIVSINDANDVIELQCPIHGRFTVAMHRHMKGGGCQSCSKRKPVTVSEFISRSNTVHEGVYDYSLVSEIKNVHAQVDIICSAHGIFRQRVKNHMSIGQGCPICGGSAPLTLEIFKLRANIIHSDKYDYSEILSIPNAKTPLSINCPEHGTWMQPADTHLNARSGCPKCSHYGFDVLKPARLYYSSICDGASVAYKVGITNKTINERFGGESGHIDLVDACSHSGEFILALERAILSSFDKYKRHHTNPSALLNRKGDTEIFRLDILGIDSDPAIGIIEDTDTLIEIIRHRARILGVIFDFPKFDRYDPNWSPK